MYSWQDEDEEGEGEADSGFSSGKSLTLFLIEATTPMAEAREGDQDSYTLLQRALACAHDTIKNKIFSSDKDCIGVVLFGNRAGKSADCDFETCRVLLPLARPSAKAILSLERLLGDQGAATFQAEVGSGPESGVRLHEALWQCQAMFAAIPGKISTKSVLLLTCRASPHTDSKLDAQARRKAVDLHNTDICLDVIPVCGPGEAFDQDKFYRDLVKLADDDVSLGVLPLEELSESVLKKTTAKRSNGRLKLDIGGTVIAVSSFNLTRKVSKPTKQKMTADTNEGVVSQRRWTHPVTGAPLLPSDINSFLSYGGRRIQLTQDEVKSVRALGSGEQTYLKLIGFKPKDVLRVSWHVRASHFLYPYEEMIKGSRVVFASLLSRCLARGVVAICQYKPRTTAEMSYVALVPQEEQTRDSGGQQAKPPGFHVVYLPFIDDIRQLPRTSVEGLPSKEAVEAAKEVINKLKLRQLQPVESVGLQSIYKMIEAHALKKVTLTQPEDETEPDVDRMTRKLGKRSQAFLKEVYEEGYDPEATAAKKAPVKRTDAKNEGGGVGDIEASQKAGTLTKLTVAQLKEWLSARDISVGNKKKADLIALVEAQF